MLLSLSRVHSLSVHSWAVFHMWLEHNLLIHSPADGHYSSLQFGAVVMRTDMNIQAQAFGHILSFLLDKIPNSGRLSHIIGVYLTCKLLTSFLKWLNILYYHSSAWNFQLLHVLSNNWYVCHFNFGHLVECRSILL